MIPKPIGPYRVSVTAGGFLFLSGQIAPDLSTVSEQTRQIMQQIQAVLKEAGLELNHVVKATIFLKSMDDFQAVNQVYGEFFQRDPPARSAVEVSRLPKDALVEIECVACLSP